MLSLPAPGCRRAAWGLFGLWVKNEDMTPARTSEYKLNASLVAASGALWAAFWYANDLLFSWLDYGAGISLVYVPAGVRLGIVLIFGVWGAIGIALSNPILFMSAFGARPYSELLIDSLIAGFVPFFVARGCQWALGIGRNLGHLKPLHLPVLALAVSICTPLAFNLMFIAYGLKPPEALWQNLSAMALGDFLGCLLVLVLIRALLPVFTRIRGRRVA